MAKEQKAKGGKTRNDARRNGKAPKQPNGRRHSQNPQGDVQLVLLGKGLYRQVSDRVSKDRLKPARRRGKDSDD